MADMLASIQQHEPLRVPAGWDKQERAMLMQLEGILDDIYRRFGRLRLEDMGKAFRKRIEDTEENVADIQQWADEIAITVADKYDKVSGIDIISAGIEISGSTYIKIKSGGKFLVDSGNFSIDENGNVNINGGGTFSGSLSAATGTFAGTLSASCVTSGTMSADRISGGALTLGGNNNVNGSLIIKNSAGNTIGTWNKDGLSVTAGSFYETVTGKYDKVSGIDITTAGVSITGNKYIRFNSGSEGIVYNNGELIIGENTSSLYGAKISTSGYNGTDTDSVKLELSVYNGMYGVVLGMVPVWEPGFSTYVNRISLYPKDTNNNSYIGHPNGSFTYGYINNLYSNRIDARTLASRTSAIGLDVPFDYIRGTTIHYTNLVQDSSRKKKHGIRDLESLGDIIDQLKPVRYVYNSDKTERDRLGLIYEDTVGLLPEICVDGDKGINYVELVPALLREIKDLRVRVARLEAA